MYILGGLFCMQSRLVKFIAGFILCIFIDKKAIDILPAAGIDGFIIC